jgi:hypothetical protein
MKVTCIASSIVATVTACGGPPKDRPLVTGYGRATGAQCTAAVDNYIRLQRETKRSRHVFRKPDRVGANAGEEREHRIDLCQSEAAATEAECVGHATDLAEAEECAPTWTW